MAASSAGVVPVGASHDSVTVDPEAVAVSPLGAVGAPAAAAADGRNPVAEKHPAPPSNTQRPVDCGAIEPNPCDTATAGDGAAGMDLPPPHAAVAAITTIDTSRAILVPIAVPAIISVMS